MERHDDDKVATSVTVVAGMLAKGQHSLGGREVTSVNNMADERDLENMNKLEKLKDVRYRTLAVKSERYCE